MIFYSKLKIDKKDNRLSLLVSKYFEVLNNENNEKFAFFRGYFESFYNFTLDYR